MNHIKNINEKIMFNISNIFKNNQMKLYQNLMKHINFINEISMSTILLKILNFQMKLNKNLTN